MTTPRRRLIVTELCGRFNVSQRRASRALDLPRSSLRYAPVIRDEQAALARRIEELTGVRPRYGYRRIWALLDRPGLRDCGVCRDRLDLKAPKAIRALRGLPACREREDQLGLPRWI